MKINSISVRNLRACKNINLVPGSNLNYILGRNGSGKTSLLESIYLLARAKSFRTNKNSSLITVGEESLALSATIENQTAFQTKLNLIKTPSTTVVSFAGKKLTKLSELARILPLGVITPDTQKLIQEGPKHRRLFLDWGVFHVEQNYADIFKTYQKLLNQRNCLLREYNKDYKVWDKELSKYAEKLNIIRNRYFREWSVIFHDYLNSHQILESIGLEIISGWSDNTDLLQHLDDCLISDIKRGYTSVGPHRADLIIRYGQKHAKEILSRGQIKLLTIIMIVSQLNLLSSKRGERPILLIDDLDAELDREKIELVLKIIDKNSLQAFITMIGSDTSQFSLPDSTKMFHVEHGNIL